MAAIHEAFVDNFGPSNKQYWGTGFPTLASDNPLGYQKGDVIWNKSPSGGGALAWQCTTTGAPGIWQPVGDVAIKTVGTTTYTASINDGTVICNTTTAGGAITITLPATPPSGTTLTFKRVGASNVTVSGTIDAGTTSAVLGTDKGFVTIQYDGTQWWIVAQNGTVTVT